jgi:hypothetical protein
MERRYHQEPLSQYTWVLWAGELNLTCQQQKQQQRSSMLGGHIRQDNRVSISVNDQIPLFSFVIIYSTAKIHLYKQKEVLKWANK